jgi:PIN domain nuclease of toxin-antitoxin system
LHFREHFSARSWHAAARFLADNGHFVANDGLTHAAKVVELPPIHKDPFDRLLVAQARFEPLILLTDDDVLGGYGDFVEVV